MTSNLGKEAFSQHSLVKNVLPKLAAKGTSSAIDKFGRKIIGQGVVRAGKGFTLFISNEDRDDIIIITESLDKLRLLIDGATETVKHKIKKKQEGGFLGTRITPMVASLITPTASSLIQPVASSLINTITGKEVMREGKRKEGGFLLSLAFTLLMKVLGKGVRRAVRGYNNMDHMDKNFTPSFKQYFNYEPRFNGAFSVFNAVYMINLDDKQSIGFHYLLTKIQLCTLILL